MENSKEPPPTEDGTNKKEDEKPKSLPKTSSNATKEVLNSCNKNCAVVACACKDRSVSSSSSINSNSSISSQTNWSIETLAHSKYANQGNVPYSEQTKKQLDIIKQLVEQQEKETAAKQARTAAGVQTEATGEESGREPETEVSTSFAQAMDWIQEEIRKAHEEREREEREEYERKKANKKANQKKWPFARQMYSSFDQFGAHGVPIYIWLMQIKFVL